jgi:hypothetical protein
MRSPAGPRPQSLLWVLLGALPLLLAIGYAGGVLLGKQANARDAAALLRPASPSPTVTVTKSPSPSPVPAPTWLSGTRTPVLRQVTGKPVLGPAYVPRDTTFTAAFPGWPFAFRLPDGWNCVDGATLASAPEAYRKVCLDETDLKSKRATVLSLLRCPSDCTSARLRAMALSWLAAAGTPIRSGSRTWYVETERDADGFWLLDLAHVFDLDGRSYLVVVFARTPPDDRDLALKIVNDIVAQAG